MGETQSVADDLSTGQGIFPSTAIVFPHLNECTRTRPTKTVIFLPECAIAYTFL